ncbi:XRE family transcriptional regulator [Halobacteriovorax sp. GB3]|uniref:XRE family transcriptional regulator n=1 Tax=Halobacteriovorax sp. GB3 TaxID=2719615 RepID=UPI002360E826|nr:XRE family transcriptional regulator [Halobacteriovorax sp. GB3]MDD0852884.1 XRE family transcriptional regulator [Halobacteriovorax sp. GB3]
MEENLRQRMVFLIKNELEVQNLKTKDLAEKMGVQAAVISRQLNSGSSQVSFWKFAEMLEALGREIRIDLVDLK